jgi:hypothetical protein
VQRALVLKRAPGPSQICDDLLNFLLSYLSFDGQGSWGQKRLMKKVPGTLGALAKKGARHKIGAGHKDGARDQKGDFAMTPPATCSYATVYKNSARLNLI